MRVIVRGDAELIRKLEANALVGPPLRNLFQHITQSLHGAAIQEMPRDTNALAAGTSTDVDSAALPGWGRMNVSADHARFVGGGTRPHMPPVSALKGWGARHGVNPYALARAIALRGTRPRPFMRTAAQRVAGMLGGFVAAAAREIEARWRAL